jgi:hypothetical protein
MIELKIVVESVLNRWSGGKLSLGPEPENGSRKHVRARMPHSFEFGHLLSCVWRLPVFWHGLEGVENTRVAEN